MSADESHVTMMYDPYIVPFRAERPACRSVSGYQTRTRIGVGSFGEVWSAVHLRSGALVAIKFEIAKESEPSAGRQALPYEHAIYRMLRGGIGIPRVHWFGREEMTNIMVLDVLGPTLEELRFFCRGRLTLKTVLMLADQLISIIEFIHSRGIVIRDVKPENMAMGLKRSSHIVHIFDFGMARSYKTATGEHIPFQDDLRPIGAPRYINQASFLGHELGRKDDLESLGFVLVWLYTGSLPWKGAKAQSIPAKLQLIGEMKATERLPDICKDCPDEFLTYLQYCRGLGFADKPDYDMLRGLFRGIMERESWKYDSVFDWCPDSDSPAGTLMPDRFVFF
ncbi:casein kinase I delta [Sistotremastrum suecicum HHB10207 ss-3]|uniref:Casein kinase I delta n=1 Tax=Sistotremastrum suecicum HHB10207 ss-3 TaxID=1314776 RepID=A0A166B705_9AGAM|nr:casein kinase I delta [Sistotremastrum suecicum HHB10207 ss-3]